jgi:hypothetical protein
MTTKETFLSLAISDPYHLETEKIDFAALDNFVSMLITAYVSRRGREIVQREFLSDTISDTTVFLTRMIEVGTVQFLSQSSLISDDEEVTNDIAFVVASSINVSMASELQLLAGSLGGNMFFDIRALFSLIERVQNHINSGRQDPGYIFSLVNFNLMGLVNGDKVE